MIVCIVHSRFERHPFGKMLGASCAEIGILEGAVIYFGEFVGIGALFL